MRKSRFSESQSGAVLKGSEVGMPTADFSRKNGIIGTTFYKRKAMGGPL